MANRFPLIVNTTTGNSVQELPSGDFLDLSSSGISNSGNILVSGIVSATGNVAGSFFIGNGSALTGIASGTPTQIVSGTSNVSVVSSGGNATVGIGGTANVAVFATTGAYVTGIVSATGNISAPYFIGNGAALTGLSASKIFNGTSEANIGTSGGNANITIGGTSNVFVVATTGIYTTGLSSVSGNITGGNILTGGLVSAAGTITGTSHLGAVVSVTGAITGAAITGSSLTVSTGNISGGNIVNNNANGVGNIGSSTVYFNTVFGKATTAQYADLAELYSADAKYDSGTVLVFGGNNEVTVSTASADPRVAGVVSTNPAHLMNSVLESEHKAAVALQGRVPTSVVGTVRKGDMMVTAGNGAAQACAAPAMGTVIGKALENFDGVSGTIEIVVGRL